MKQMEELYDFGPWCCRIEPYEGESISHYLGRVERANLWTAFQIGKNTGLGGTIARWEKLYFNPHPTEAAIQSLAQLLEVEPDKLASLFPAEGSVLKNRPIRLCGACYTEVPCHRIEWQYKSDIELIGCARHRLRLLSKCPQCKHPFPIPSLWNRGGCENCSLPFGKMARFQRHL